MLQVPHRCGIGVSDVFFLSGSTLSRFVRSKNSTVWFVHGLRSEATVDL